MTRAERINKIYFHWLCSFVELDQRPDSNDFSWAHCFRLLYNTEYTWVNERDENRACDGLALRWRFILDNPEYEQYIYILDGPCNVLEMMVALAVRCEEQIMDDPAYGNRTYYWFFSMIRSLGMSGNYNAGFNRRLCRKCLDRWMNGEYEPDGKGGLFTLKDPPCDLREVEIWVQLNWWLNERYM